jgi:hypothetical protein
VLVILFTTYIVHIAHLDYTAYIANSNTHNTIYLNCITFLNTNYIADMANPNCIDNINNLNINDISILLIYSILLI